MSAGVEEEYSLERLRADYKLISCVLLVVQACFATADIFKGWGNNRANFLPWLVRLCRLTQRLDVPAICDLLPEEHREELVGIFASMQDKAAAGIERLAAEHGSTLIESL